MSAPERLASDWEDNITCPACGAIDIETCDYPTGDYGFREGRDGGTAQWTCDKCGAHCTVTLSVNYAYQAVVNAAPPTTETTP